MAPSSTGRVSGIQRACTGDGPGYRTVVFLQGCHLHCPWCHNPDYQPFGERVEKVQARCIACGKCEVNADETASRRVAECPAGALVQLGALLTVEEVMQVVRRDAGYYRDTGGGMTLSGGEPLMQMDFTLALLAAARKEGISAAIETSCAIATRDFSRVVGKAEWYLCDIKASREAYPKLIGADPELVYANIAALSEAGCRIVIRIPSVAGMNFDDGLAAFVADVAALENVQDVELLPYHDLGRGKADRVGLPEPDWSKMSAPSAAEQKAFLQKVWPKGWEPLLSVRR